MTKVTAQLSVSLDGFYAGPRFDGHVRDWISSAESAGFFRVVTNRPRETLVRKGGTSFTYVTDGVASAVERARAAAGGKDVAVAGGGTLLRLALKEGLADELELHIVPVVLGTGMRLFDADLDLADKEAIELAPIRVVPTPEATHVRYRIQGRAPLVLDNRGAS